MGWGVPVVCQGLGCRMAMGPDPFLCRDGFLHFQNPSCPPVSTIPPSDLCTCHSRHTLWEVRHLFQFYVCVLKFDWNPCHASPSLCSAPIPLPPPDLHGNFQDLMAFENALWRMGPALCPASLVFLGTLPALHVGQ